MKSRLFHVLVCDCHWSLSVRLTALWSLRAVISKLVCGLAAAASSDCLCATSLPLPLLLLLFKESQEPMQDTICCTGGLTKPLFSSFYYAEVYGFKFNFYNFADNCGKFDVLKKDHQSSMGKGRIITTQLFWGFHHQFLLSSFIGHRNPHKK